MFREEKGSILSLLSAMAGRYPEHHYLNPSDPNTLYKGDGTKNKNNVRIITTVAGNGQAGFSGDGGSATKASLFTLMASHRTMQEISI